jgi:hypothetical protein
MSRIIIFAENWEELTPKQVAYIFKKLYTKLIRGEWDEDSFRLHIADYLLGQKKPMRKDRRERYGLLVRQCADTLHWMFLKTETGEMEINFDTLHNHFASIKKTIAPSLMSIRFGEYRHAVALFHAYHLSGGDESILATLAGLLYRKANEPFAEHGTAMQRYEQRGKRMPRHIAYYIYVWFATMNRFLLKETFTIDGCDVCFAPIFATHGGENKGQDIGLNSILFTLADTGTFGNADETDKAPLFRVMLKLLHDKNNADNLKNS